MAQRQRARGGSRRRNLQRRRARASLLQAARELASERGYRRLRAGEIASRAGVSRETFYTHFPDKQACVAAACDPELGEIENALRIRAAQGERWAERLLRGVGETLEDVYLTADEPRARTLDAVLRLAAERGYENVALKELIREAQINKSEFARLFGSIEVCFQAAFARMVDRIEREAMAGECSAEHDVDPGPVKQGLEDGGPMMNGQLVDPDPRKRLGALLRHLSVSPTHARVLALEAVKLSPAEGSEAGRGGPKALEELIERLLFIDVSVPPPPEKLSLVSGAVAQVIRADVAAGQFGALRGRLDDLWPLLTQHLTPDSKRDVRAGRDEVVRLMDQAVVRAPRGRTVA